MVFTTSPRPAPSVASWASRLAMAWRSSPATPPADQLAVDDADLARHDQPVAGPHDGRVRPDRLRRAWSCAMTVPAGPVAERAAHARRPVRRAALRQPGGGGHRGEHGVGAVDRRPVADAVDRRRRSAACRRRGGRRSCGSSGRGPRRPRRPPGPRSSPSRAPCGRRRRSRSAAPPRRAARRSSPARRPGGGGAEGDLRGRDGAVGRPDGDAAPVPSPRRRPSTPGAPPASSARTAGRRGQGERLGPAGGPQAADVGGPGTSTSSTTQAGRHRGDRLGDLAGHASGATTRSDTRAVGAHAAGHRRPLRPEAHGVLPGEHARAPAGRARRPAPARPPVAIDADLAAERAAVGQRASPARRRARTTTASISR